MDKLRSLFKQAGVGQQLADAIIEEIGTHTKAVKEEYDRRFDQKLNKAQKVAQDLLNKEKVRLAKRVGIYLEAKKEQIDRTAEKQRLNEDTEATSLLKRTRALLEGINIDDPSNNREIQVTRKQITRLQRAVGTLKEERDLAVRKANEANTIAIKHLKISRLLESKLKAAVTLSETKPVASKKTKTTKTVSNIAEGKKKSTRRRLDSKRRAPARGKSTRPIMEDNQKSGASKTGSDNKIAGIAARMDD